MGFATSTIALVIGIIALFIAAAGEAYVAYASSKIKNGGLAVTYTSILTGIMVIFAVVIIIAASFIALPPVWVWALIIGMFVIAVAVGIATFSPSILWNNTTNNDGSCDCVPIMANTAIIAYLIGIALALAVMSLL